jgi:hypothetical protein
MGSKRRSREGAGFTTRLRNQPEPARTDRNQTGLLHFLLGPQRKAKLLRSVGVHGH